MRTLASVQRITEVRHHPNADTLDIVKIQGWTVVTKRDQFNPNNLCVYIEIDSIVPLSNPHFTFLEKTKGRIKTAKLRGQISQGIAFPLDILLPYTDKLVCHKETNNSDDVTMSMYDFVTEGQDVTELLGITKYEPPEPAGSNSFGITKGSFPAFLRKTDEVRLQSCEEIIHEMNRKLCYASMKLDGSSVTIYYNNGIFGACSRNLELDVTADNKLTQTIKKLQLDTKLKEYCDTQKLNIALQGEFVGVGIQSNRLGLVDNDIRFFNLYDITEQKYLGLKYLINVCDNLQLRTVPIVWQPNIYDENKHTLEYWLNFVKDMKYNKETVGSKEGHEHLAEGIVIRTTNEFYSETLCGRTSFKVINPEYLLKIGE